MSKMKSKTGLPTHRQVKQTTGGNALKPDTKVAKDKRNVVGTAVARHHVVKPSGSAGSVGGAKPVKSNSGGRDSTGATLGKPYILTKKSK